MPIRPTKLYPTVDNCQRDTDGATGAPLDRVTWWVDYLQTLLAKLPTDEQPSARLRFTSSGPELWYEKQVSQADIDQARYLVLLADVERRAGDGDEAAKALLKQVRQVV